MYSIKEQYAELLALTKQHLHDEYSTQQFITISQESHKHFSKVVTLPPAAQRSTATPHPMPSPTINPTPQPKQAIEQKSQPAEIKPIIHPDASVPTPQQTPDKSINEVPPKTTSAEPFFTLHPLGAPSGADFKEIKQIITQHLPDYPTIDNIPDDQEARKINVSWKQAQTVPDILILAFNDSEKQQLFLHNIASAISLCLAPARVVLANKIEQEQGWKEILTSKHLRLVITSDYGIYTLPELMKYFKEQTKQGKHLLGNVPLLLLSDLSLYLKEPQLKPLLWRAICAELK